MRKEQPIGYREKPQDNPKVAVMFDEETFNKIKKMAAREKRSFSNMVCELCKVGILDLEDSDQHEVVQLTKGEENVIST